MYVCMYVCMNVCMYIYIYSTNFNLQIGNLIVKIRYIMFVLFCLLQTCIQQKFIQTLYGDKK